MESGRPARGIEAVLFDLDGVIADSEPLNAEAYIRSFGQLGVHVSREDFRQAVCVKGMRVTALFRQLGGRASDADIYRLKDSLFYGELAAALRPRPGVRELLIQVQSRHIPCAIVTTARREVAHFTLDRVGVPEQWFAAIVALGDTKETKPNPEPYLLALERLGAQAGHSVAIEDSASGVASAAAAGLVVIATPTPDTKRGDFTRAALEVDDLTELSVATLAQIIRRNEPAPGRAMP